MQPWRRALCGCTSRDTWLEYLRLNLTEACGSRFPAPYRPCIRALCKPLLIVVSRSAPMMRCGLALKSGRPTNEYNPDRSGDARPIRTYGAHASCQDASITHVVSMR